MIIDYLSVGAASYMWQGLRAQQPQTGLLASKWVVGTSLYTASTPVTMTGLLGDETWGMGRREASLETGKHGLPISTYQETQPWRLKEHLGNAPKGPLPSQICSPPLAESPLDPFVVEEDFREACWRSHRFHASREREAQ